MQDMQERLRHASHLGVAEAKANLSNLVMDVERSGTSYVIERYGRPAAMLVPLPVRPHRSGMARGRLSAYADPSKRGSEKGAFSRAMEADHGHHA